MFTIAGPVIVYGVSELLSTWKMRKAIDEYDITHPHQDTPASGHMSGDGIQDVDYEKVDEQ